MKSPLDPYSLKARLFPAFVMLSPIALGAVAWTPDGKLPLASALGLLTGAGLSFLLAEFVRDIGKQFEPELWKGWGGAPTTQLLRHTNTDVNPHIRKKWRSHLETVTGTALPSEAAERTNPRHADLVYEAAVLHLREVKRDDKSLTHKENTSYGFRRNLLAIKQAGIMCCVIGLVSCVASVVFESVKLSTLVVSDVQIVCAVVISFLLVLWISRVCSQWVRTAAFEYAKRLLGSLLSP